MKKLNVIVKDRNTLVLEEDAQKGDYIDLSSLSNVDFSTIEALITSGKDEKYNQRLADYKKITEADKQAKVKELENEINSLKEKQAADLKLAEGKLREEHIKEINDYKNKLSNFDLNKKSEIDTINSNHKLEDLKKAQEIASLNAKIEAILKNQNTIIDNEKLKMNAEFNNKINELKEAINKTKQENEIAIKNQELAFKEKENILKDEFTKQLTEKENALKEKNEQFLALQRQKAALNVKQTGEDLEVWCDNEMLSYRQVGLFNTTWTKDNEVIKDAGETKGSKADFIFRIYANDAKNPNEELASVCLDMKDENPDSNKKQTNEHYYNDLDKNRKKKNCKYAVLVSNLETDKPNDLPIWRVDGFDDMYVVRPAYMMTFLSMLNSLTTRFALLLLKSKKEDLELANSIALKDKFNELKTRYLDNPLLALQKSLEVIRTQSTKLKEISTKIDDECDKVTRNYLNEIETKLAKFDIEIDKAYRKAEKENKAYALNKA